MGCSPRAVGRRLGDHRRVVAFVLWNHLGAGPLDVFISAFRTHTGLPLTFAVWITIGALTLLAWALGRRPGLATIIGPFIVGPTMQVVLANLQRFEPPRWLVVRIAIQLLAVGVVGLGAGAVMASRLGQGTGELLALAAVRPQRPARAADATDVRGLVPRSRRIARRAGRARHGADGAVHRAVRGPWSSHRGDRDRSVAPPGQRCLLGAATLTADTRAVRFGG